MTLFWEIKMKKWTYLYIVIGLVWTGYYINLGGGESGIAPFIITSIITFPIGLLVWSIAHVIPWELILPLMLILNYFQWAFLFRQFNKIRAKRWKEK